MSFAFDGRFLIPCIIVLPVFTSASCADELESTIAAAADWPHQVVITVGDIRTRIDGPKMWTLSGIDFMDNVMATEDSAYGAVLTIRNVGHLGTAHFLDVPGKPGEIEKENVIRLQLFVDEKPVDRLTPTMNLVGDTFRMERRSTIRTADLETTLSIRHGILTEKVHFRMTGSLDLQVAYPWMYAWTPRATEFVFGNEDGIQKRGRFLADGKTVSEVVKDATWMAIFDPSCRTGGVCCLIEHPTNSDGWFLMIDAPGVYRKIAAYTLVDEVVSRPYEGTFQSAVGFFTATPTDWEVQALHRAEELRSNVVKR